MQSFGSKLLTVLEEPNSDSYLCVGDRSYSTPGDGQVHENPEWEKARQALASINKTQNSAKNSQANRSTAEVWNIKMAHSSLCLSFLRLCVKSL